MRGSIDPRMRWSVPAIAFLLLAAACASPTPAAPTPTTAAPTAGPTASPQDRWAGLLVLSAFPYARPLPADEPTPVDGTYVKLQPGDREPIHCLRCPDFLPDRGLWKLSLDRGTYRLFYAVTGWRTIGSYTVSGDRLELFNDPNCTYETGTYRWQVDGGQLVLEGVEDTCAIGLRAANLTSVPWQSCQPPNQEAAVTDHWQKPEGCD